MITKKTAADYRAELADAAPPANGLWYQPGEDGFRLAMLTRLAESERDCGQCEGTGTTQSCGMSMEDEECPVCDGTGILSCGEA